MDDNRKALSLCRNLLTSRGYRLTAPREAVISVLAATDTGEHLTAEAIYQKVHSLGLSVGLTSIYRSLDLLVHLGVANKFDFGDGRARYELEEGPRGVPHHHHLVCDSCGLIIDYHEFINEERSLVERTEEWLSENYGFMISRHVMNFHGLCSVCKQKGQQWPPGSTR